MKIKISLSLIIGFLFAISLHFFFFYAGADIDLSLSLLVGLFCSAALFVAFYLNEKNMEKKYRQLEEYIDSPIFYKANGNYNLGLETRIAYPPPSGWGCYIAKISYCNGDVEILGSYNIEYISVGHSPTGIGMTMRAFKNLICSYKSSMLICQTVSKTSSP